MRYSCLTQKKEKEEKERRIAVDVLSVWREIK